MKHFLCLLAVAFAWLPPTEAQPLGVPLGTFVEFEFVGRVLQLSDGRILVDSSPGLRPLVFLPDGTPLGEFNEGRISNAPLVQLSDGRVLITSRDDLLAFTPEGKFLGVFAENLNIPTDALQLPDGRVLVAEVGANAIGRVSTFDPDGTSRAPFARGLPNPSEVELHPDGRVLVAESNNDDLRGIAAFAQDRTPLGRFASGFIPTGGVLALPDGRVLVSEASGLGAVGDVAVFSAEGEVLGGFAASTPAMARSLALLQDGRVLVSYPREGEVRVFGVVSVSEEPGPEAAAEVSAVWPSPVRAGARARVWVEAREPGLAEASILDALGRAVRRWGVALGAGREAVEVRTAGLSPGAYAVRVTAPGVRAARRFVVVR